MVADTKAYFPPIHVSLRFCPVCGRDDRYRALRLDLDHNTPTGKRCPGRVETLRYDFAEQPLSTGETAQPSSYGGGGGNDMPAPEWAED
jgi:hypothetical protein